ncbi:4'-phosphopantetheinyl transferase superfamily protein [Proteus mirabilis]
MTRLKKHNFYKMWTLKEAYIKSRGIGLSEEIIKNLDFYIKEINLINYIL